MYEYEFSNANQATARGFYEAGGVVAVGYPGTPTATTIQYIQDNYPEIYTEYSQNEEVATQVAVGASISGGRAMVNMKNLGVNVALDTLMTFTQAHINGGFILYVADDPGLQSTQNEQDSRVLGKYADMGIVVPGDNQEAKDFVKIALELSESYDLPMMFRVTTPQCFTYENIRLGIPQNIPLKPYKKSQKDYCMFPPYATAAQIKKREALERLEVYAYNTELNSLRKNSESDSLIITVGYTDILVRQLKPKASILKLGLVYPISKKYMKELSKVYREIIVCEELLPFVEDELKIMGIDCKGKEYFPFTGKLTVENVAKGLIKAGVLEVTSIGARGKGVGERLEYGRVEAIPCMELDRMPIDTLERTPVFFSGCPHRPIFNTLKNLDATIIGDIGCYTIGMYFPWHVNAINLNMGSSAGIAKGIAEINLRKGEKTPIIALMGDGTFFHSGMQGIFNLLQGEYTDSNITIIVLDNGTTALTGWEPNPGTGNQVECKECKNDTRCEYCNCFCRHTCGTTHIQVEEVIKSYGFEDIVVIDQFEVAKTTKIIKETVMRKGIKFIIATRPCVPAFCVQSTPFKVDAYKCIACGRCVELACEAIQYKCYRGQSIQKAFINPVLCNGCTVCSQVCPVGAISRCE